jgi:hypothetical protein
LWRIGRLCPIAKRKWGRLPGEAGPLKAQTDFEVDADGAACSAMLIFTVFTPFSLAFLRMTRSV